MESKDFLIYAGATIVALLIYRVFLQWAFQIRKRNRYLKAQTQLLGKIALQHGVAKEEVNVILSVAEQPEPLV